MIRILFIAYHFPPVGGAGVQRAVKFVRYLVDEGFLPVVVTGPGPSQDRWTPEDASLLAEVPPQVVVHRLTQRPGHPSAPAPQRLSRFLGFGSPFPAWWADALLREGEAIARREQVRLVFATMSPFETAEPAAVLAARIGVPWVADLRDAWALDETQIHASSLHLNVERRRMRRALATASTVVMNTPEAASRLTREFPEYRSRSIATITNGFDQDDFKAPAGPGTDGLFTIAHAGYLHAEAGEELLHGRQRLYRRLGGVARGLDLLTRSHVYLLRALDAWAKKDRAVLDRVRLELIGTLTARDGEIVQQSAVARCVVMPGYLSHVDTLLRVRAADLLFLPLYNLPPGDRATVVPGKAYEYIASGRRILAALPDGDARDFVTRAGTGTLCRPDDVDGMARGLASAFAAWQRGESPAAVPPEFLHPFERRQLTRALAAEFHRVLEPAGGR